MPFGTIFFVFLMMFRVSMVQSVFRRWFSFARRSLCHLNSKMHNLQREGAWLGLPSRFKFETSCKRHAPILPAGAVFFSTVSERSSGPCEPFQHAFANLPVRRYHGGCVFRRVHFPLSIFGKMGLRPGMGAQLRPVARHITVSKEYKGKNVL